MRFAVLVGIMLVVIGALFVTNPRSTDFDAEIERQLVAQINGLNPDDQTDDVSRIIVTTCKIGRSQCARLLRSLMEVKIDNRVLYSKADVRLGDEVSAKCYGLLGRIICL